MPLSLSVKLILVVSEVMPYSNSLLNSSLVLAEDKGNCGFKSPKLRSITCLEINVCKNNSISSVVFNSKMNDVV